MSSFGLRNGEPHEGIDIAAPEGTDILAAENGTVIFSDRLSGYGKTVMLKHAHHWVTLYAHCQETLVAEGDVVERGDIIARVGETGRATGPHLHFEVRQGEMPRNPLDHVEVP